MPMKQPGFNGNKEIFFSPWLNFFWVERFESYLDSNGFQPELGWVSSTKKACLKYRTLSGQLDELIKYFQ